MSEPTEEALNNTIDSLLSAQYNAAHAEVGQNLDCAVKERKRIKGIVMGMFRAQRERIAALEAVIARHDLCHNLHGKVDARAFADGCAQEQRKLYGCAPDADDVRRLRRADQLQPGRIGATGIDAAMRTLDAEVARCYGIEHP